MAINENTSVVRIPVADPRSHKEGLLNLVLPKECFEGQQPPTFWGTDSVETSADRKEPEQPAPVPTEQQVRAAVQGQAQSQPTQGQ